MSLMIASQGRVSSPLGVENGRPHLLSDSIVVVPVKPECPGNSRAGNQPAGEVVF